MTSLFSGLLQPLDSPAVYIVTYATLWLVSFSDLTQLGVTPHYLMQVAPPTPQFRASLKDYHLAVDPRVSPGPLVTLKVKH